MHGRNGGNEECEKNKMVSFLYIFHAIKDDCKRISIKK